MLNEFFAHYFAHYFWFECKNVGTNLNKKKQRWVEQLIRKQNDIAIVEKILKCVRHNFILNVDKISCASINKQLLWKLAMRNNLRSANVNDGMYKITGKYRKLLIVYATILIFRANGRNRTSKYCKEESC